MVRFFGLLRNPWPDWQLAILIARCRPSFSRLCLPAFSRPPENSGGPAPLPVQVCVYRHTIKKLPVKGEFFYGALGQT